MLNWLLIPRPTRCISCWGLLEFKTYIRE